ncbi:MAG: GntP family permease [Planctomycetaceae bacterium]|nr:GntP family permease [Planctomycetaceae bacterium]
MGLAGILLSLMLLMYFAYRDVSVLILAPLCALFAVALDGELPMLATYTQIFMASVGTFIASFFPLFLLGAVFGKLMEDSGAAARIADAIVRSVGPRQTVLAVVLSCAVLTYGGVSLFVVVFAVFPLARSLFRKADVPRRLIPAAIALGSFTFTMTAMPGTVQIQNQIPMPVFGTTSFAAPGLGLIGSLLMLTTGMWWLNRRVRQFANAGEGFDSQAVIHQTDCNESTVAPAPPQTELPSIWTSVAPVISVVVLNFLFSHAIIPGWDTSYLETAQFGEKKLPDVLGTWSTILSMLSAILMTIAFHFRSAEQLKASLASGARASLLPVFNTACEFGYGNTIRSLAGFTIVSRFVTGIAPHNPLITEAASVNTLAGITGSASGGLSIVMKALGPTFLERGTAAGISPELMHRVASMSCGGLDSLPHNGAVITLLLICGVTHRQGYRDIAVVSILSPLLATVTVVWLGTMFGSF